jgi:hypothetical protein
VNSLQESITDPASRCRRDSRQASQTTKFPEACRSAVEYPLLSTTFHDMKLLFKQHRMYESEHTQFIKGLKDKNPSIEAGQQQGRSLLWDKAPATLDEQARQRESRIAQQAYVYQNKL